MECYGFVGHLVSHAVGEIKWQIVMSLRVILTHFERLGAFQAIFFMLTDNNPTTIQAAKVSA